MAYAVLPERRCFFVLQPTFLWRCANLSQKTLKTFVWLEHYFLSADLPSRFWRLPDFEEIRQSQIKTAACSLLRDFQRECVPGHVVPNQITTEAHCPMKSRYTVKVHFR